MRISSIKRYFISILLAGFLSAALLPFFAQYNVSTEISSLFGDKILICTSDGFKLVSAEDYSKETDDHTTPECPLCYLAALENKYLPNLKSETFAYTSFAEKYFYPLSSLELSLRDSFFISSPTRAPPFFVA